MLIIDAHLDLAWNALQWERDLHASVYTTRTRENRSAGQGHGQGTVAFPEMRRGKVALSFVTVLARSTGTPAPGLDYISPAQAYGIAQGQLAYYKALEQQGTARIITDAPALREHMTAWEQGDDAPLGFVISMEGADAVLEPDDLETWYQAGLRLLGPTHYGPGRYAGGTGSERGLTDLGVPLLREMERLNMVLDLTHCSDAAFWECFDHYHGNVLASHSNCRALVPNQRQFSDDQLEAIIARDGVIGVALDAWMLQPGWVIGQTTNEHVSLENVADHIDHICELAGDCEHVGIGTDLDGGFGYEQSPHDLETIADLQKLGGILEGRGYSNADIAAIMHGNWQRFLERAWSS